MFGSGDKTNIEAINSAEHVATSVCVSCRTLVDVKFGFGSVC